MKRKARRAVSNWLPQRGKNIEVRHPLTGRRVKVVSEHTGFKITMTIAVALIIVAAVLFFHGCSY